MSTNLQNRAKQLYAVGYTTLQKIAKANPHDLVQNIEFMTHRVAGQLIAAAKVFSEMFLCHDGSLHLSFLDAFAGESRKFKGRSSGCFRRCRTTRSCNTTICVNICFILFLPYL